MEDYAKRRIKYIKDQLQQELDEVALHPTDSAKAFRDIESYAGEKARIQEEKNERDGVPERPKEVRS